MKALQTSFSMSLFLFILSTAPAVLLYTKPGLAGTSQLQHEEFTLAVTKSTLRAIEARKYLSPYPTQLLKIAQGGGGNRGGGGATGRGDATNDDSQSMNKA